MNALKEQWENVCQELLNLYKEHDFLMNIATGNESWVHQKLGNKSLSIAYYHPCFPKSNKI